MESPSNPFPSGSEPKFSPPPPPPAAAFRNRRVGLIVFGIALILAGAVCALFVPLVLLGGFMAQASGAGAEWRMLVPSLTLYALLAVAFVWIGVGSLAARRWARALALILSWVWLLTGVITVGMMALLFPMMSEMLAGAAAAGAASKGRGVAPMPDEGMAAVILVITLAVMAVIFVIVPGVLVLFYRSPHVRATCEAFDPRPSWTDACPLPVLGLSLSLAFMAIFSLPSIIAYGGMVPMFGTVLTGFTGIAVTGALAGLWGWCAWATWRMRIAGWWAAFLSTVLMTLSGAVTFATVDLIEIYRRAGFPEEQMQVLEDFRIDGRLMAGAMIALTIAVAAWMLSVKRHFAAPRFL